MKRFLMMRLARPVVLMGLVVTSMIAFSALSPSFAQSTDSNSALMARQQTRLNSIEDNLKTVRGTLETEFRAIRLQIEEIAANGNEARSDQGAKIKALKGQIMELGDTLDIFNQRLRRSIELSSDIEFRVLRMEKRMQTLLSLGSDQLNDAILQEDATGVGTAPSVAMSRDNETGGATWTVERDEALDDELAKTQTGADNQSLIDSDADSDADAAIGAPIAADDAGLADNESSATTSVAGTDGADNQANNDNAPAAGTLATDDGGDQALLDDDGVEDVVPVLPQGSPEEQYRFAFGRMLQNDLETAEAGFAEFRDTHSDNERSADALYWLGRVQFIQADYGKAAISFTAFNTEFPEDARLPEAILMIAESVLNFATSEQACQIFADLPQMLDQPSDSFVTRLTELKTAAACAS